MIVTPITYDDIKTLAAELGRPAATLIALAPGKTHSIAPRPARPWRAGSRTRSGPCSIPRPTAFTSAGCIISGQHRLGPPAGKA